MDLSNYFNYSEYFFTIGRQKSIILNISDLITFLSIDTHTLDFLIANEIVGVRNYVHHWKNRT